MGLPGWLCPWRNIRTQRMLKQMGIPSWWHIPQETQQKCHKEGWLLLGTFREQQNNWLDMGLQSRAGGRQAACSGWHRQNSSVLSSCLKCVLAASCLATDGAEIMDWICSPISWAWLLPPWPAGTAQEGSRGLVRALQLQEPRGGAAPLPLWSFSASC